MYNRFRVFFNGERGGIVFWMILMPFIVSSFALALFGGNAFMVKATTRSKLENALLSAVILSKPTQNYIDPTVTRLYFDNFLQKNLELNSDYSPRENSVATGPVKVLYYNAINMVPSVDPILGNKVVKPSLEAEIEVPVVGNFDIKVFSRVSLTE